ncbi:unnamed protein product [Polarella glacialis]|uniref:PRA1 family protein n=1 Tax=Polarella glacialis TaxID=89957 RepID=A0A813I9M4_POLGL|nr:unnamed protein product [Polarella glacialis]CAE8647838.1 unnamed protein product [Polarella glacialis]
MAGGNPNLMDDLLGPPSNSHATPYVPGAEFYTPSAPEPGKTVDLSGNSSMSSTQPASFAPSGFVPSGPPAASFGGGGSFSSSRPSYNNGTGSSSSGRGPSSIEGGGGGLGLSLAALNPTNIMRELTSRPVSELVNQHGRTLLEVPRYMARAYTAAARRYLRPWSEFARVNPARLVEGVRQASRRGEIQIYFQRNVVGNVRHFCPNYAFMFLAMLFAFVCTSPMLILMLGGVGGGWAHALRSEQFRTRPWQLQIGGASVPLGSNVKMGVLSIPTLLFLHFFMGPVLWSAALASGGVSLAHAAMKDRDDHSDKFDDPEGDSGLGSSSRLRELP